MTNNGVLHMKDDRIIKILKIIVIALIATIAVFAVIFALNFNYLYQSYIFSRNWNANPFPDFGKIVFSTDTEDNPEIMDDYYYDVIHHDSYEIKNMPIPSDWPGAVFETVELNSVTPELTVEIDEVIGVMDIPEEFSFQYDEIDFCVKIEKRRTGGGVSIYSYAYILQDYETNNLYIIQDFVGR